MNTQSAIAAQRKWERERWKITTTTTATATAHSSNITRRLFHEAIKTKWTHEKNSAKWTNYCTHWNASSVVYSWSSIARLADGSAFGVCAANVRTLGDRLLKIQEMYQRTTTYRARARWICWELEFGKHTQTANVNGNDDGNWHRQWSDEIAINRHKKPRIRINFDPRRANTLILVVPLIEWRICSSAARTLNVGSAWRAKNRIGSGFFLLTTTSSFVRSAEFIQVARLIRLKVIGSNTT